jgi:hypothetical protein
MMTFDKRTIDSTGAFVIGQLEKFDPRVNEPLVAVTYTRDVSLRTDVSLSDSSASFTQDFFAAKDGETGGYIGANTTTVGEVGLDVKKVDQPLNLWAKKAGWTIPELMRSMQLGRPLDVSKVAVLAKDFQMVADKTFYLGSTLFGTKGLLNNASVSSANATNGNWSNGTTTADEIVADINELLSRAYENAAYAVCPTDLLVDPDSLATMSSMKISSAGNISVLEYAKTNCLSNTINGRPLNIRAAKYAASGEAVSNKNMMVAYSNDPVYIQFPLVPLQRQQMVYQDIAQSVAYIGATGVVEFRYPETVAYSVGI